MKCIAGDCVPPGTTWKLGSDSSIFTIRRCSAGRASCPPQLNHRPRSRLREQQHDNTARRPNGAEPCWAMRRRGLQLFVPRPTLSLSLEFGILARVTLAKPPDPLPTKPVSELLVMSVAGSLCTRALGRLPELRL